MILAGFAGLERSIAVLFSVGFGFVLPHFLKDADILHAAFMQSAAEDGQFDLFATAQLALHHLDHVQLVLATLALDLRGDVVSVRAGLA